MARGDLPVRGLHDGAELADEHALPATEAARAQQPGLSRTRQRAALIAVVRREHVALLIHTFHHRVIVRLSHETGLLRKADFEKIRFRVKPDFYLLGHYAPIVSNCIRASFSALTRFER